MSNEQESVLVAGFNIRPLVYSLNRARYNVYAVDFFGDLDLYPSVKDCLILTKKLSANYDLVKNNYSEYLPILILELLDKYPEVKYLIIGSGLDDAIRERALVLKEIKRKKYKILSLNNEIESIKKSRDTEFIFNFLKKEGFDFPRSVSFNEDKVQDNELKFPFILKKKRGSGGINVYKIQNKSDLTFTLNLINSNDFDPKEWMMQEYIEGNSVSCTIISNGIESKLKRSERICVLWKCSAC